jgi:glycosyltransferase involved in cell wall biosynthesis
MNLGPGPVILYLGSLRACEGIDLLISSVAKVRQQFSGVRLLIVGAGEVAQRISERASIMGETARVLAPVPHSETRRFYAASDLVVYPRVSTRATELVTPLKPLEAMAMGKAIVASDVGGLQELLTHNETARLFPAGSLDGLANAISELLESPSERRRLGEAARRAVDRYDWRSIIRLSVGRTRRSVVA